MLNTKALRRIMREEMRTGNYQYAVDVWLDGNIIRTRDVFINRTRNGRVITTCSTPYGEEPIYNFDGYMQIAEFDKYIISFSAQEDFLLDWKRMH